MMVLVFVRVGEAEKVLDAVGLCDHVGDGVDVRVIVRVNEGVLVGVGDLLAVIEEIGLAVGEKVGLFDHVGEIVEVGVSVNVNRGVAVLVSV